MKILRLKFKIDKYFDFGPSEYYSPYESQPSNHRMSSIMSTISDIYANFSGMDKVKIDDHILSLLKVKVIKDTWFYRIIIDIPYNEDNYDIIKSKLNHSVKIILGQYLFIVFYSWMLSYEITDAEDIKDSILNKDYSRKVPTKPGNEEDYHKQLFAADDNRNRFRLLLKIDILHYESADPIKNLKYEDRCYIKDRIDSINKRGGCITLTNFKNAITGTFGIEYIDFKNKTISVIIKAPYKDTGELTTYLFGSSTCIPDLHVFVSFTDENFKLTADLISCRLLKETEEKKMFEYIISMDPKSDKDKELLQSIVDNDILNYRIVLGLKEYIISQYNTVKKLYEANGCYNLIISSDKTISQVDKCSSWIIFYPSRFGPCQEVSATVTIINRYIDTDEKEQKKKYRYTFFFNCYWTKESDFLERIIDRDLKEFWIEIGSDKKSFEITSDNTIKYLHKVGYLDTGYTIYAIDFISEEDIESKFRTTSTISYLPSPVAVTQKESFTTSIARIEYVDIDEYKKEENKVKIADYKPIVAYKLTLHPSAEYAIKLLKDAVSRGTNFSIHRKDANIIINCNQDRILKPIYKKLDHSYELFIKADVILSDGSNNLNDMECSITLYNDNYAAIGYIKHILIDAEPIYDYVDIVSLDIKSGDYFLPNIHYDGNKLYTFASDGSKIVLCSNHSTIDDNTNNEEEKKDMKTEAVTSKSFSVTFKNGSMISVDPIKYNPKPGRIDKMVIKLIQDNVKSIIFHEPETKIIWKDGTETTVSCRGEEKYDKEYGALFCVLKKLLGNTSNYYDLIKNLVKLGDKQEKIRAKVKADKEAKRLAKRRERQMKEAQEKDLLDSMVDSNSESNT